MAISICSLLGGGACSVRYYKKRQSKMIRRALEAANNVVQSGISANSENIEMREMTSRPSGDGMSPRRAQPVVDEDL